MGKHTSVLVFLLVACSTQSHSIDKTTPARPVGPIVIVTNAGTGNRCSAVVVNDSTLLTSKTCIGPNYQNELASGVLDVWTSYSDFDAAPGTNEPELGAAPVLAASPVPVTWADSYIASSVYDIAIVPLIHSLPAHSMNATLSYAHMEVGDDVSIVNEAHSCAAKVIGSTVPEWTLMQGGTIGPSNAVSSTNDFVGIVLGKCQNDVGAGVFDDFGNVVAIVSEYPVITSVLDNSAAPGNIITATMLGAFAADMQAQLAKHASQ